MIVSGRLVVAAIASCFALSAMTAHAYAQTQLVTANQSGLTGAVCGGPLISSQSVTFPSAGNYVVSVQLYESYVGATPNHFIVSLNGNPILVVNNDPTGFSPPGTLYSANGSVSAAGTQTLTISACSDPAAISWNNLSLLFTPGAATPSDSLKLRSLQASVTPIVATTSGSAIIGGIENGINDGFSPNGSPSIIGPTGAFVSINDEPRSQIATRADEAFASLDYARNKNKSAFYGGETVGPLGYSGNPNKAPDYNKAPPLLDRVWSAWADIRGTGWKGDDTTGNGINVKGDQLNLTAGIGRKLTVDTLVGVVGGYENFKYNVAALAGSLKGDGETIGGYFAQRFGGNLRFDAALAWTNVNYNATAGTATGSFTGSRWLASTGLTGTYKYNVYVFEPSAKVYALWESEKAWTDNLGTLQPSRNFSAGRTALGAKVGRSFEASNGWTLTPNAGLYGDWRFQSDSALPTATPVANIGTGWSGRVTGGLAAKAAGGCVVSLDGEYGGLGATYKIWTGNLHASIPF